MNGFTTLWLEEDETSASKFILNNIESTVSITNSEAMASNVWVNVMLDESSHWDEVCDSR